MTNSPQLRSLEQIAQVLEVEVPVELSGYQQTEFTRVSSLRSIVRPGSIHFEESVGPARADELRERGATLMVADQPVVDSRGVSLPTLLVSDPLRSYLQFMQFVRRAHSDMLTVAVTGSNGKTTTKQMIAQVLASQFKTYESASNRNAWGLIGDNIQTIDPGVEVYVQEVGAGPTLPFPSRFGTGQINAIGPVLEPNAVVVTNIGFGHVGEYGGHQENLMADKVSLDQHLAPGGSLFVNFDDPLLRTHDWKHRVVSYGTGSDSLDYQARNIRTRRGGISFDVVEKATATETRVRLRLVGDYNVSNALAAFAVGRWMGIERQQIASMLRRFRTAGVRQHYLEVGGHPLFIDTFNASEVTAVKAGQVLSSLEVEPGAKRIYVVTGVRRLEDDHDWIHRSIGRSLAVLENLDKVIGYDGGADLIVEEIKQAGGDAVFVDSADDLVNVLNVEIKDGDALAFKGAQALYLGRTVDRILGTDFQYDAHPNTLVDRFESTEAGASFIYRDVEGYGLVVAGFASRAADHESLELGGEVEGNPVLMVGRRAFRDSSLRTVSVGAPIISIAAQAFRGCHQLHRVSLPETLRTINRGAFRDCTALEAITLPEGLTTIRGLAFASCSNLQTVFLPSTLKTIERGAFRGLENTVFYCPKSSGVARLVEEALPGASVRTF